MTTTKIVGGAGCGKTTTLIREVKELLETTPLSDICMMTLTRNAKREFVERIQSTTKIKTPSDMRWFGTMHSTVWKFMQLCKENMVTRQIKNVFCDEYMVGSDNGKMSKMVELNDARRNCMEQCSNAGFANTYAITGLTNEYTSSISGKRKRLDNDELVAFGKAWNEFMVNNNLYDYTGMLEYAHESMHSGNNPISFTKLFVDEFQDFSRLQHAVYLDIVELVDDVWICGDDLQVIYRFSGATPKFMLEDIVDKTLILPRTYRYGAEIMKNSLKYIDRLDKKIERTVDPADHDDEVVMLRGSSWTGIDPPDGTTAYLARTNADVRKITAILDAKRVMYNLLGVESNDEAMLRLYNTIRTLHDGGVVISDDAKDLVRKLPATVDTRNHQISLGGEIVHTGAKSHQYLKKGVSRAITKDTIEFDTDYGYNIDTFGKEFMHNGFFEPIVGLNVVKGMRKFIDERGITFPDPMVNKITTSVGTIHKFKGNEADTVFLFTDIPFPISAAVRHSSDTRDDERRVFYVGATRAKSMLYEVDGAFMNNRGQKQMGISDIL